MVKGNFKSFYQFKVTLRGIRPPIWRRILIPGNYNFWDFHVAIQGAMGWQDYHLHEFLIRNPFGRGRNRIGIPNEDFPDELPTLPGWKIPITSYFTLEHSRATYLYDFGDGWEHTIVLEAIHPRKQEVKYPCCVGGRRACPPEDCGGSMGYEELVEACGDPKHERYQEYFDWLGQQFDPEAFDVNGIEFDDPTERWRIAFLDEEP